MHIKTYGEGGLFQIPVLFSSLVCTKVSKFLLVFSGGSWSEEDLSEVSGEDADELENITGG